MNKQSVVAALLCCLITSTTVAQEAVIQMPQQAWSNRQEAAIQGWDDDDWCGTKPRPPFPRGIYDHGSYIPWNSNPSKVKPQIQIERNQQFQMNR